MSPRIVKSLPPILAIAGVLVGALLIGRVGFARIAGTLAAIGWSGLALVCAWQMVIFVVLGMAWTVIVPGQLPRAHVFIWGRMVRDAAATCLPFSRLGGFVLGIRALALARVGWPVAAASTVVDVAIEFLAEIGFVAFGLAILLVDIPDSPLLVPLAVGLGVALILGLVFLRLQRRAGGVLFTGLASRIARRLLRDEGEKLAVLRGELSRLAGDSRRLAFAGAWHLLGWLATGVAGWIGFRLVGAPIGLVSALAIEGLLHGVLAVSFLVPGNVGVQEAAYIGLAAAFGVPPEAALGVSLLRRARDLSIGIPTLLGWQLAELRRCVP